MNCIFVCFILFLNATFMFSQNEYQKSEDSLQILIKTEKNNSIKIEHYEALCNLHNDYDIEKLKVCNDNLLVFSKISNNLKGVGI